MEKLKSRKAEVGEQLDRSRSATRFEAPPARRRRRRAVAASRCSRRAPARAEPRAGQAAGTAAGAGLAPDAPKPEEASYTNRLLKAKQRVWEEREKEKRKTRESPDRQPTSGPRC